MSIFIKKDFVMHSGELGKYKIECDGLTDEDIETIAFAVSEKIIFSEVYGIPRGGVRLANALEKRKSNEGPLLIVDDVLTTGSSMEEAKEKFKGKDVIGLVIFSRGKCKPWIDSLFQIWEK